MKKELRAGEEGAREDTRKGNSACHSSPVPDSQENDPGDEKPPGGSIPVRKSRGRETAEGVHRWMGPLVYRIYSSSLLPHL